MSRPRQSARDSDHVRFGNADVDKPIRNFVAEQVGLGLARKIGAETYNLRPTSG
jgi:hypothetical protein